MTVGCGGFAKLLLLLLRSVVLIVQVWCFYWGVATVLLVPLLVCLVLTPAGCALLTNPRAASGCTWAPWHGTLRSCCSRGTSGTTLPSTTTQVHACAPLLMLLPLLLPLLPLPLMLPLPLSSQAARIPWPRSHTLVSLLVLAGLKQYPNYMMGGGYVIGGEVARMLVDIHAR